MVSCRLLTNSHICTSLPCRFSLERAASAAGWQQELAGAGAHTPESEQLGITSFVYRAERPFHPGRLWQAVAEGSALPPVLRSKGFFWVAARPLLVWQWSTAGSLARIHLRPACTLQGVLRLGDVPSFSGGCLRDGSMQGQLHTPLICSCGAAIPASMAEAPEAAVHRVLRTLAGAEPLTWPAGGCRGRILQMSVLPYLVFRHLSIPLVFFVMQVAASALSRMVCTTPAQEP